MVTLPAEMTRYIAALRSTGRQRDDMPKFRCVAAEFFLPAKKIALYRQMLTAKGLEPSEVELVIRRHIPSVFRGDDFAAAVAENVHWSLNKAVHFPARFNTEKFGAYYAAKEASTARAEREYHFRRSRPSKPLEGCIFVSVWSATPVCVA